MKIIGLEGDNSTGTEIWSIDEHTYKRHANKRWFTASYALSTQDCDRLEQERDHYFYVTDPHEWMNYAVNIYFK